MVGQPTEYSKRKAAIQEAYRAASHLRKSSGISREGGKRQEQWMRETNGTEQEN